jgi:chemotaxis protein methyltransferase CheR
MSALTAEPLAPAQLAALRDQLAGFCGVYLDDTRVAALEAAVALRARESGRTAGAYASVLRSGAAANELQRLAELLLNHETQFFRNRPHMQALRDEVIPELHRRLPPGAPLRLWSAGCATGEEPYSLAIAACEALGEQPLRPVEVWATDLSEPALERARAGVYRGRSLGNLTPQQRARFFTPCGDGLALRESVRRLVRFEQLNLLAPFPPAARGVQVVFCQNVTIYFQVSACRQLMERFYLHMAEGGYLFLGFSETLWNIFDRFRWRGVAGSYVYYKESSPSHGPQAEPAAARPAPRPPRRAVPVTGIFPGAEVLVRGRELLDAGQAEAALELFYAAPLAGVNAPQILALAARAHADRGDLDLAAAEARRALELGPLTVEAHLLIGLIHARQGRPAEAIAQLERASYLDGESPVIAFHLAECYRQAGRRESALREYRTALRRLAGHPPDRLFDGVAAGWLSETCRHYEAALGGEGQ